MTEPYLSIIIPTYNEAKRLPATLIDIDTRLRAAEFEYEILVVDNGSEDGTADTVKNMSAMIRNLQLLVHSMESGKGAAVRQGMLLAKGKIRLFTDADNATTIDHFDRMIPFFDEGYGVVIGDRAIVRSILDPPQPWYRQIAGKTGNLIIQALLLPGFWDTQCGFKAFAEDVAMRVFSLSEVNGWAFDAEVLALTLALGYRVKQVPVRWVAQPGGKVKPSVYLEVLLETARIRWRLSANHYKL
jgi:dolichyl-phosphate beta-glucosyltransferase